MFDGKMEREVRRMIELLECLDRTNQRAVELLESIDHRLQHEFNRVLGGAFAQLPLGGIMNPIQPGQTVKFLVTPTFSGPPFPLVGAQASVNSSDPANFPVNIDLADDPTGATFESVIPSTATPVGATGEDITVNWVYTNNDGTTATVTGTVTEQGIVDDVTGGTFAQVQ